MLRFVLALVLVTVVACDAYAWPFRRRASNWNNTNYTYTYSNTYSNANTYGGGPQAVAEAKASRSASMGIKGHIGGGYGGANAEGVGFSTYSAQHALNNCCFTGQRSVAGSAVVRGNDGWYAVKLYW